MKSSPIGGLRGKPAGHNSGSDLCATVAQVMSRGRRRSAAHALAGWMKPNMARAERMTVSGSYTRGVRTYGRVATVNTMANKYGGTKT